jgi:hypothetical protein
MSSIIVQNQLLDIGKIKLITKEINLNADRKRLSLGKIESVDAEICNDSMPISLDYFAKNEV